MLPLRARRTLLPHADTRYCACHYAAMPLPLFFYAYDAYAPDARSFIAAIVLRALRQRC